MTPLPRDSDSPEGPVKEDSRLPEESVGGEWWPALRMEWWRGAEPWPRDGEDEVLRMGGER
jgi:hypothetical protein